MNKQILKKLGASIYLDSNYKYLLQEIKNKKITHLFISLHIPEQLTNQFNLKVNAFLKELKKYQFKNIICDISPIGIQHLGPSWLTHLADAGINRIRLDYGFTIQEITNFSHTFPIAINASQITKQQIDFLKKNANMNNIVAFHNYFPLPGTGLSSMQMAVCDQLLRKNGINNIYSFIPGKNKRNNTPMKGLPTLEKHRFVKNNIAFHELSWGWGHDIIFIGDPSIEKINDLPLPSIKIKYDIPKKTYDIRVSHNFIRLKQTRNMAHSESGESILIKKVIIPNKKVSLVKVGDVVVCNNNSARYEGEVMICIKELNNNENLFNVIENISFNQEQILSAQKNLKIIVK